jgi:hypothetical protein
VGGGTLLVLDPVEKGQGVVHGAFQLLVFQLHLLGCISLFVFHPLLFSCLVVFAGFFLPLGSFLLYVSLFIVL